MKQIVLSLAFLHHAISASSSQCVDQLLTGVNCWGEDLVHYSVSSPEHCCDTCFNTPGCDAFTYDIWDPQGAYNPTCFMKHGCSDQRGSPTAISWKGVPGTTTPAPTQIPISFLPGNVSVRVAKALGSRGYDKVRISLIRTDEAVGVDGVSRVWSYASTFQHRWKHMHISSAVITVEPGSTQILSLDGHDFPVRIPVEGQGSVGLLMADPCIRQSQWCYYANTFDVKNTLNTVINSLAAHNELDYWMNIGDLFYDQSGDITWEFFSGLSIEAAGRVHGVSFGNHDFWNAGSPGGATESDNFGNGLMQWYAQDTMSSKFDSSQPFNFSMSPPQVADASNFFWYYMMGNVAFISFSGHQGWADSQAYFEEACTWAESQNPTLVVLMGHWDSENLGCSSGMATPEVYSNLLSVPGCSSLAPRIKYFEGHTHCNHITNPNTGFMVGSFGFEGCGDFGLPILDTRGDQAVLYYFRIGQGGVRNYNWDTVLDCIKYQGLTPCLKYADIWMEQANYVTLGGTSLNVI